MTGAEILALLKDSAGYGLAAFFAWMWLQERARTYALQDSRLADWRDFGVKFQTAIENGIHAMDRLEEVVRTAVKSS